MTATMTPLAEVRDEISGQLTIEDGRIVTAWAVVAPRVDPPKKLTGRTEGAYWKAVLTDEGDVDEMLFYKVEPRHG